MLASRLQAFISGNGARIGRKKLIKNTSEMLAMKEINTTPFLDRSGERTS